MRLPAKHPGPPQPRAEISFLPCPHCGAEIRNTALRCPACGAEKHFGPTLYETAFCALAGALALPLAVWAVTGAAHWFWLGLTCAAGAALGVLAALFRFSSARWLKT
ncbi:zinc ribbon domain-containing protein [Oecophyllibacter saccharovorans]|uniref:Zinc ribbon domain-containing protein n=1 Tax=Oecophyllibacter saccharovorans TaxID=2558360 RepID=A0A506ULU9_9PROT|nr:zinc ribbon domain-containing protein [Oecophyllibacter saccharovorans]TPW34316.1 zinc ribbon domain-containing protein [Oecophyllibacter saccharovorans]